MKQAILPICLISLLAGMGSWFLRGSRADCSACLSLPSLSAFSNITDTMPPVSLPYPAPPEPSSWKKMSAADRVTDLQKRVQPILVTELRKVDLELGAPAYLRAFKENRELELWLKTKTSWQLFRTYPIAAASGELGPKLKEGDGQVPEGFYAITSQQLNPASNYHLAMNIGYPNAYDRHHERTGSFIMIHGSNVSIGCLAMTDPVIEEIYLIIQAALSAGQASIPTHFFPFRMTPERLQAASSDPNQAFWKNLLPSYQAFEEQRQLLEVKALSGEYKHQ